MIPRSLTMPEIGLIAGTRAALGFGVGLLIADRLAPDQRRAVGWTLVAVGVLSTFPLLANVLSNRRPELPPRPQPTPPVPAASGL